MITIPETASYMLIADAARILKEEWVLESNLPTNPVSRNVAAICREWDWKVTNGEIFSFIEAYQQFFMSDDPMEIYRQIRLKLNEGENVTA